MHSDRSTNSKELLYNISPRLQQINYMIKERIKQNKQTNDKWTKHIRNIYPVCSRARLFPLPSLTKIAGALPSIQGRLKGREPKPRRGQRIQLEPVSKNSNKPKHARKSPRRKPTRPRSTAKNRGQEPEPPKPESISPESAPAPQSSKRMPKTEERRSTLLARPD